MLIALVLPADDRAHRYVHDWIRYAGGSMTFPELDEKIRENFHFLPLFHEGEAAIQRAGLMGKAIRLEGEIVSLQ
jgi:hypothetical protein